MPSDDKRKRQKVELIMSVVQIGDLRIHWRMDGNPQAPVLLLSNSLGTNLSMWDAQIPSFARTFCVLRYDTRGHGESSVTPGTYTIDQLGKDAVALLDELQIERAHFCGLSMGGMIGMWLGRNAPQRLDKLVLCNTAAQVGTAESWNARIDTVEREGMRPVAAAIIERWFTPEFRAASPAKITPILRMLEDVPPKGYQACCAAVRDMDQREDVHTINAPTLIIAGGKDPAIPPAASRFLRDEIRNAAYLELEAAHLSNVEQAEVFTGEVLKFLET